MERSDIVDIMSEIYPREEAEKRVVQTSPDTCEVNCEIYKRNVKNRAHARRSAETDSKALFASHNLDYKEQTDGNLMVSLKGVLL
jgi:hypothetical protein